MKQLLLLRHAKSSWDDPGQSDFERPLNARGREDAPRMGRFMREARLLPTHVVCSPARRARETWEALASAWPQAPEAVFEPRIYEAGVGDLQGVIETRLPEADRLLLVGHEPALSGLVALLTGERLEMPTCALAVIALERVDQGRLCGLFRPRALWRGD